MPVTQIRGIDIQAMRCLGRAAPSVALQPGRAARRRLGCKPLGHEDRRGPGIASSIYDRRNSQALLRRRAITGGSENDEWAEDLHELLRKIDASPAYIGGSSSGCRLALILALRHPEDVLGLLLWRVTGGRHAAVHLANQYYTSHIEAAKAGGMAAVCVLDHWKEVIGYNLGEPRRADGDEPGRRHQPHRRRWRDSFNAGTEHPVIGLSARPRFALCSRCRPASHPARTRSTRHPPARPAIG